MHVLNSVQSNSKERACHYQRICDTTSIQILAQENELIRLCGGFSLFQRHRSMRFNLKL